VSRHAPSIIPVRFGGLRHATFPEHLAHSSKADRNLEEFREFAQEMIVAVMAVALPFKYVADGFSSDHQAQAWDQAEFAWQIAFCERISRARREQRLFSQSLAARPRLLSRCRRQRERTNDAPMEGDAPWLFAVIISFWRCRC
jgi:hypothetical protein